MPINEFSDHCALHFCIERRKRLSVPTTNPAQELYLAWDDLHIDTFRNKLLDNINTLHRLADNINNSPIEESVSGFTTFMQENAFSVFGKRCSQTRAHNANGQTSNTKWFNAECYNHRKDYKKARNLFLRNKSNENRQNFIHKKRTYNKTKRKCKYQFKKREGERIAKLAKSNSKSFWKNIKSQYKTKANEPEISINDLFTHFNGLYGSQTENTTNGENDPQFRSLYDHDLDFSFTEHGRFTNLPREQRICNHCNSLQTESEYHFLLICTKYADIRSKYIKRYYYTWPTIQKFTNLLSEHSKATIRNIAKYVYYANLRRTGDQ